MQGSYWSLNHYIMLQNLCPCHQDSIKSTDRECSAYPRSIWIGCAHRRTGRHFTGGAEKVCPENNNLP